MTPALSEGERAKPRLLVLRGGAIDAAAVSESLVDDFEIVITDRDHALETLASHPVEAVLAPAEGVLSPDRMLLGGEASTMLNALGEGIALLEPDGVELWSNTAYGEFDDQTKNVLGVIAQDAAAWFTKRLSETRSDEESRSRRYRLRSKKRRRWYEVLASAVVSATKSNTESNSASLRIALAVRDVTSRERTRAKIEAVAAAGQAIVHLEPDEITKLHSAERLKLLEDRIVKYADELLHFDHFAIRMIDPNTGLLHVVMARDLAPEALELNMEVSEQDNGISGLVAATGEPYICDDVSADPRYIMGLPDAGSSLTVPLKLFDKVVGVFNIESHRRRAFTEVDQQFAEMFAGYIALALHFLDLLNVERRTTREQATGTVRGELSGPLNDLVTDAESLRESVEGDETLRSAINRVLEDVGAIRTRMRRVAEGAQTVLGIEDADMQGSILSDCRVLVVDDEQTMRETIRDVLTNCGARVRACRNAEDAKKLIEAWGRSRRESDAFDLIISDINTGDGTGYEVFAAARAVSDSVPVILMTGFGYDPHHSIVRASQEGLQGVLFKPFRAEKLIQDAEQAVNPDAGSQAQEDQQQS